LVRWDGAVQLTPFAERLLRFLLGQRRYPIEVTALEDGVWGRARGCVLAKTIHNRLGELNEALLSISFPWTWRLKGDYVQRDDRQVERRD
jgi:hypothetical protein